MDTLRSPQLSDDLHLLLNTLLEVGQERADVRAALRHLRSALGGMEGEEGELLAQRTLTPHPSRRDFQRESAAVDQLAVGVNLELIVKRARWKAESCRFAIRRRSEAPSGTDGDDLSAEENNLRARREELEDCYAWMLDSPRPLPEDKRVEEVALCYDIVARAAELCIELKAEGALSPVPAPDLLFLLAESQSSLLTALAHCDLRGDSDQRDLFLWLKEQTTRHRVYVDRHMRLDDPADSTKAPQLMERLEQTAKSIRANSGGGGKGTAAPKNLLAGVRILVLAPQGPKPEGMVAELGLDTMRWVELEEGAPAGELLDQELNASEHDLVVLATRLAEDDYARFKGLCAASDTLFVRMSLGDGEELTGENLASECDRQIGERLRS
ncbi:MAG TPA: hypothetical protein EYQ74_14190 [Planctomycetes bacterium]|nr:hypothetical protein [Planctomycetota bacterium]